MFKSELSQALYVEADIKEKLALIYSEIAMKRDNITLENIDEVAKQNQYFTMYKTYITYEGDQQIQTLSLSETKKIIQIDILDTDTLVVVTLKEGSNGQIEISVGTEEEERQSNEVTVLEEEKIVGKWIDEKYIYQKILEIDLQDVEDSEKYFMQLTTISEDFENLVDVSGLQEVYIGNGEIEQRSLITSIDDQNKSSVYFDLERKMVCFTAGMESKDRKIIVVVQYTKNSDVDYYANLNDDSLIYELEQEKVIGKWVDNSSLYQKTFKVDITNSKSYQENLTELISGYENLVEITGVQTVGGSNIQTPVTTNVGEDASSNIYVNTQTGVVYFRAEEEYIDREVVVTFRYTKEDLISDESKYLEKNIYDYNKEKVVGYNYDNEIVYQKTLYVDIVENQNYNLPLESLSVNIKDVIGIHGVQYVDTNYANQMSITTSYGDAAKSNIYINKLENLIYFVSGTQYANRKISVTFRYTKEEKHAINESSYELYDEKLTGEKWVNDKPVYQKTLLLDITSNTSYQVPLEVLCADFEELVELHGVHEVDAIDGEYNVQIPIGTDFNDNAYSNVFISMSNQSIYFRAGTQYENRKVLITFKYTKSISELADETNGNNYIYDEEKEVGTWVDGKTIYQKTLQVDISNNTLYTMNLGLLSSEFETLVDAEGMQIVDSGNTQTPLVCYYTSVAHTNFYIVKENNLIYFTSGTQYATRNITVTFRYTKTTDVATEEDMINYEYDNEKRVGTWIDGKDIYQNTILVDISSNTAYNQSIDTVGLDIDYITEFEGVQGVDSNYRTQIPLVTSITDNAHTNIFTTRNTELIYFRSGSQYATRKIILTLRYTKNK